MRPLSKANEVAPPEPFIVTVTRERARLAPGRHLLADPLDRFLAAIVFGPLADLLGERGVRRLDDEILRAIGGAQRSHRAEQHESDRGA